MRVSTIFVTLSAGIAFVGTAHAQTAPAPVCEAGTLAGRAIEIADVADDATIPGRGQDGLRLVWIQAFSPPCGSLITAASMGDLLLTDGTVLRPRREPESGYAPHVGPNPFEMDSYDTRTDAEKQLPRVGDSPLLDSDRVNARAPGVAGGDFVGLWRVSDGWTVQSFSQRADRTFTAPATIMTSALPLRSVRYFPAPDTQSGRLSVVQEQPEGAVRVLSYDWYHPGVFARGE